MREINEGKKWGNGEKKLVFFLFNAKIIIYLFIFLYLFIYICGSKSHYF
jgi:hypothetical protein